MSVRARLYFRAPVKAEKVAIGISEIKLLHAIRCDPGFFYIHPESPQMGVGPIDIGASKVNYRVLVGGDTRGIGSRGTLALIVRCVQHEFRTVQSKQHPIEVWSGFSI